MQPKRRFAIVSRGSYLHRYDAGWMEYGDDPTSWTDDKARAKRMTLIEAERLLLAVRHWQEASITTID